MVAVLVVQVVAHQVIGVISVRHGLMAASFAVLVRSLVRGAAVRRGALVGILLAHVDGVLFHLVRANVVQMAVVQVIDVARVHDGDVAALFAVLVGVSFVEPFRLHWVHLFPEG